MKYVIRKAYWNYEKEEAWLNEMSAKGMALIDYTWCRYVFEDSEKGEYIYRIVLLKTKANSPEGTSFIHFMEDTGAERVATYLRWVYFRKKSTEGAFDLYSDVDSKLNHYKRILHLWMGLAIFNFIALTYNLGFSIYFINIGRYYKVNLVSAIISALVLFGMLMFIFPCISHINKLKTEKLIHE